jgi:hypothetical protein
MFKRRVIFTFNEEAATEPTLYNLGQQFNIVTNIRRANMSEDGGWIEVELEGEEDSIGDGLDWVTSKGVRVDPASSDETGGS